MKLTLGQIAAQFHGRLIGDASIAITGARTLSSATSSDISFSAAASATRESEATRAAAVLTPEHIPQIAAAQIIVPRPQEVFAEIVAQLHPRGWETVEHAPQAAYIHPTAQLGDDVRIGPGCYVGANVILGDRTLLYPGVKILAASRLGADVILFPNVVVYENTVIGDRCRIHAGVVLGADGFGYSLQHGQFQACRQLGWVEIGQDVEIGANTTIDRGTYGPTTIGDGVKIDNLVMIGHNCRIGKNNLLCSQVGIAGSTSTGDYVVMGGQAGIRDHVHIGDGVQLGAQSGVSCDLEPGESYFGSPAQPAKLAHRITSSLSRLPDIRREVRELRRLVEKLAQSAPQSASVQNDAA